jgi:GxxExxY protein
METPDPEALSYIIIGVLYDVYNELGFGYQEKYYYRAIKEKLLAKGLTVVEQLFSRITIGDKIIGRYFLDFLVSNDKEKIVLEMKIANEVYPQHIRQVLGYLKANKLKLGLVGVISKNGVIVKRVIA